MASLMRAGIGLIDGKDMKRICFNLAFLLMLATTVGTTGQKTLAAASGEKNPPTPGTAFTSRGEADIILDSQWNKPGKEEMREYTLGPEDVIAVDIERHPEFSGIIIITKEGRVSFTTGADRIFRALPEYKDLRPVGLTIKQLEEVIKQKIKIYLFEPEVTVSVLEYGSKKYYVVGEVARPGRYPIKGSSLDLQEAIFEAGLPTPNAALRRVQVIKSNSRKAEFKKVNLYALLYRGDLGQNVKLEAGDIVYVPSTIASKVNTLLDQILNPASRADTLQRMYYQFDTEYYRTRYRYEDWYYKSRQTGTSFLGQ